MSLGSSPPMVRSKPSWRTRPHRTGVRNTTMAPAASASPSRASINAWLSMMPVEGDSTAATQRSAGSSRCAWVAVSHCKIVDAVGAGRLGDALDTGDLTLFGSDDKLADLGVRDPVLAAIGVEPLPPGDAAARLQAAGRIIKPAMDDLAVA